MNKYPLLCNLSIRRVSYRILACFAAAFLLMSANLIARPLVSVGRTLLTGYTQYQVDINYNPDFSGLRSMAFQLTIEYDETLFKLDTIKAGRLLTDCNWEIFTHHLGATNCAGECPPGLVTITAIRSWVFTLDPACDLGLSGSGPIAVLLFSPISPDVSYCTSYPVRFYWETCADNLFTNVYGNLFSADTVFRSTGANDFYPVPATLHTNQGRPGLCGADNSLSWRAVNYREGGIETICGDPLPPAFGDLNLNGLTFEVADADLFASYFLHGLSVFSTIPSQRQQQMINSNVNHNGLYLEYRDLIYILRAIAGDVVPFNDIFPADTMTAVFTHNRSSKSIRVDSRAPLAGAYLTFAGEITPTFLPTAPGNVYQSWSFENGVTKILLAGSEADQAPGEPWFTYSGEGTLLTAETTDLDNSRVYTQRRTELDPVACGDANRDLNLNISDIVVMIWAIFAEWQGTIDLEAADANCDGFLTVADAVYLFSYLYSGGTAPCAACP